ncbi:MAG: DUF4129 domain-containing protein [Caldilineaceae bacterium]|nr:DUF4129 domain-containing protein [Caldilineaceae bacterium]
MTETEGARHRAEFDHAWQDSLLRPAVIAALVGCLVVALTSFVRHIGPGLPESYLNVLRITSVGAALVGGYTTTMLVRPEHRQRRTMSFRLSELGLILFTARIALWATVEGWPAPAAMVLQPFGVFLTLVFIINALFILIAWGMAVLVTNDFLAMGLQADELADLEAASRPISGDDHRIQSDRGALVRRFSERWAIGGMLLIVLTAASQVGMGSNGFFALVRQDIAGGVIGAAIVYFVLGLLLLTFGHLAALRARWQLAKLPSEATIVRNWPFYAFGLLLVVAAAAFLMPLGGTFRLAQLMGLVMRAISGAIYLLMGLIIGLIAMLFGGDEEIVEEPAREQPEFTAPQMEQVQPAEAPPWLGGTVFWIIIVLLLGYATYIYLQGRGVNFQLILAWLRQFLQGWKQIGDAFNEWRSRRLAPDEELKEKSGRSRVRRWLDELMLGRLAPDEQVRYFYVSTLESAAEHGMRRRPGETPYNFQARLGTQVESEDAEAAARLTDGFVRIEFAHQSTEATAVPLLKRAWTQLRDAIAGLNEEKPGSGEGEQGGPEAKEG